MRSSETVVLRAPGARTAVVERLSSRGLAPLHTEHCARKFRPEIRSTERAKSQILNSAECYDGVIVTCYNQVTRRGRRRKEKYFKYYFSFIWRGRQFSTVGAEG